MAKTKAITSINKIIPALGRVEGLFIKKANDRFWAIICSELARFPGTEDWEEIPEYLFLALNRFEDEFEDERQQAAKEQAAS
jgi:radical SAM superfamily enzyme YgiQ (UPF0313 family)